MPTLKKCQHHLLENIYYSGNFAYFFLIWQLFLPKMICKLIEATFTEQFFAENGMIMIGIEAYLKQVKNCLNATDQTEHLFEGSSSSW